MNSRSMTFKATLFVQCVTALLFAQQSAHAGPGHDHGEATAAPVAGGPQRLPDGSIFLPKLAQHQLAIRTMVVKSETLARTIELPAEVKIDPNAGGRVQAPQGGQIQRPSQGFPTVGSPVKAGQILAYVMPLLAPAENISQKTRIAELRASRTQAVRHLERMNGLADTVPQKEIDAAQSTLATIDGQLSVLNSSSSSSGAVSKIAIVAPTSGVIASTNVLAGQIVEPRDMLFEIIDPERLFIEARTYDTTMPNLIGSAFLFQGGEKIPLEFVGASRTMVDQALPLTFRAKGKGLRALAVNQPVKIQVQSSAQVKAMAIPSASLARSPSNEVIVWIKTGTEKFESRVVTPSPLDGERISVTGQVPEGARIVVQGASLVNQIR